VRKDGSIFILRREVGFVNEVRRHAVVAVVSARLRGWRTEQGDY
jgi:hypothetical protein